MTAQDHDSDIRATQQFQDDLTIYDSSNGKAWISSDTTIDVGQNL